MEGGGGRVRTWFEGSRGTATRLSDLGLFMTGWFPRGFPSSTIQMSESSKKMLNCRTWAGRAIMNTHTHTKSSHTPHTAHGHTQLTRKPNRHGRLFRVARPFLAPSGLLRAASRWAWTCGFGCLSGAARCLSLWARGKRLPVSKTCPHIFFTVLGEFFGCVISWCSSFYWGAAKQGLLLPYQELAEFQLTAIFRQVGQALAPSAAAASDASSSFPLRLLRT